MQPRAANPRGAFTLVEMLMVIAIIGVLISMLLPAVQQARHASYRTACANNLHQLGIALHACHDAQGYWPAGITSTAQQLTSGDYSGYLHLLPYMEGNNLFQAYDFDHAWYDGPNHDVVTEQIPSLLCPANRSDGTISLAAESASWSTPLPPQVAATDYALCKGANAALVRNSDNLPSGVRGAFDVNSKTTFGRITDGTSHTMAAGDATGGSSAYRPRDPDNPDRPAVDPIHGDRGGIDQAWAVGSTSNRAYPYYGSVLAVTAQRGYGSQPLDEPMNPGNGLVMPTIDGNDNFENRSGRDSVSGFRSLHTSGCNFLFCDASLRFLDENIDAVTYRRASTLADGQ